MDEFSKSLSQRMHRCDLPPAVGQRACSLPRGSVFGSYFEQWKRASPGSFKGVADERHDLKSDIKERGRQSAELVRRRFGGGSRRDGFRGLHEVSGSTLPGPVCFLGSPARPSRPSLSSPSSGKSSWAPGRGEVTLPACAPALLSSGC